MSDVGQQINLCWNKVIDIIVNYQYWLLLYMVTGYWLLLFMYCSLQGFFTIVNCMYAASVTLGSFCNDDGDAEEDAL